MTERSLLICSWPGLARLWIKGRWASLGIAAVFSLLLNVALLSTFVWPELLGRNFSYFAWLLVGFIWLMSMLITFQQLPRLMMPMPTVSEDLDALFIQGQSEYLKGHFSEAESCVRQVLNRNVRDAESRLLLATLYRHSDRFDEAYDQLEILERFDESIRWQCEIDRERELLHECERFAAATEIEQSANIENTQSAVPEPAENETDTEDSFQVGRAA